MSDLDLEEKVRKERMIKSAYFVLDELKTSDTLKIYRDLVEDALNAMATNKLINEVEHKRRFTEISGSCFDFEKKKITIEEFKKILTRNLSTDEVNS